MKRIVLIDGENLVYGLRTILGTDEQKANRSILDGYNYRGLIEEMLSDNLPTQILWFGARLRRYDDNDDIRIKSESAIRQQAPFMNQIQAQNIQFIKVGYLRARELDPCKQCNNTQWKLTEKGVDVGLAVRMLVESQQPNVELVVISADTDLIPAFKAVGKTECRIIHVGYEYMPIASLSQASNATRTITLPITRKYLDVSSI